MKGKVVIVTGASSGIGEATVRLLGKQGAQVVLASRRVDRLRNIEKDVKKYGGEALVLKTDVSSRSQIEILIQMTLARFGKISALVNNAGFGWIGKFQDLPEEELIRLFHVNVLGTYWATQAALPSLIREKGVIINVASVAGLVPSAYSSAYAATKAAQIHLNNSLKLELRGSGVRVANICPGLTRTEFFRAMNIEYKNDIKLPAGIHTAEDVAKKVVRAIKSPRRFTVLTLTGKLGWLVYKLCPWLYDLVASGYFRQRRKMIDAHKK